MDDLLITCHHENNVLNIAENAAREAGTFILNSIGTDKGIRYKGRGNLLTKIDLESERIIIDTLKSKYPEFGFLSEETHCSLLNLENTEYTWIIDPLDGTNNFVFGIPFFCVSIALAKGHDILIGVIYDPIHNEMFAAEKGKGLTLNKAYVKVSEIPALSEALLSLDTGYDYERNKELMRIAGHLRENTHCMRALGSMALALAYVACGRITAYIQRFMYPWDFAAGLLMISEAGGKVTDWNNNAISLHSDQLVATNGKVHKELMGLLNY